MTQTLIDYWISKIEEKASRKQLNKLTLETAGWKVITVWECELKKSNIEEIMLRIVSHLITSIQ
jgi:DNA mismatch endonuclease (patch repair protein)